MLFMDGTKKNVREFERPGFQVRRRLCLFQTVRSKADAFDIIELGR